MKSRNSIINSGASGKLAIFFIVAATLLTPIPLAAQTDPLPSWNDGATKKAIVDFVQATTDQSSSKFVPPLERVATFDQDGTLWVEHPMYSQVVYCLDRVPALVKAKPELANVEPFKTVLTGDLQAIAKLPKDELVKVLAATLTGMSVDQFQAEVKSWLKTAKDPRWKRPYTELTYLPMTELLKYLRESGYKTYITTGGGQDFVRVYCRGGVRHSARAGGRQCRRHDLRLRQGGQTVSLEGTEVTAQRQRCRKTRRYPLHDRAPPLCVVRQFDG